MSWVLSMQNPSFPRLYSVVDDPLALIVRPGRQDHLVLSQLLSEGRVGIGGIVFDPCCEDIHGSLKDAAQKKGVWCVLDTKMLELATLGGFTAQRQKLPWAASKPHAISDFRDLREDDLCALIAQFVADHGYTAVLAPTHYLAGGTMDPWFSIDCASTQKLRAALDRIGKRDVHIFYPFALPMTVFRSAAHIASFVSRLRDLPIASLWLRVSPFGSDSGHVSLENYINSCRILQNAGVPLVAEKTGTIGLALLAFGAVSGLDTGVATGDKFDFQRLRRVLPPKKFGMQPRVYIERLNCYLSRRRAAEFFAVRGMREFACHDTDCCLRGVEDMLENNKRHFLNARAKEVSLLSGAPLGMRPAQYLDEILRPATDQLGKIPRYVGISEDLASKIERENRKLSGWRATLSGLKRFHVGVSDAKPFPRSVSIFGTESIRTNSIVPEAI